MREFNYKAAWKTLAFPTVMALPQEIRDLFLRVREEAMDLRQSGDTLDMPWPDTSLLQRFAEIPSFWLALASKAIHSFGHWASDDWRIASTFGNGAYWKFANYADQTLSARLGIKRNRMEKTPAGVSFQVMEGAIRGGVFTPFSWQWQEIGPATQLTFDACKAAKFPPMPVVPFRSDCDKFADAAMKVIEGLRTQHMLGQFRLLHDTERFMEYRDMQLSDTY
jgi:hypothetical protein